MSFYSKLDRVVLRFNELRDLLSTHDMSDPKEFAKLSKEYSDITEIAEKIQFFRQKQQELKDAEELYAEIKNDPEMRDLIESEIYAIKPMLEGLETEIKILLLPKDADDERNAILEVRAGTGGEEAGLFAAELMRMYQRYAALKGWTFEFLNYTDSGLGAIKEASASISGKGVFAKLKFESGVHRVQRVPETEASGRIHTSAATVAVLPEVEDVDINVEEKDLQIDVYRASGAGGQHVNTTDSAVRITHIPTGVVVCCQDERSQHKNKAKAMKILRARIYEAEQIKKDAERAAARKIQVGSGDRSERIRTYNFPQGRVTDHRINLTLYKIEQIMQGDGLDDVVDALAAEHQAALLSEQLD
jgi:peptide chain release factor 1